MMAAADAVTADKIWIGALQVSGRNHMAAEDLAAQTWRIALDDVDDMIRIAFLVQDGWKRADLNRQNVATERSARRIDDRRLGHDQNRLARRHALKGVVIRSRHRGERW